MDIDQRIQQVFISSLNISPESAKDTLEYNSIPEWDSTAHMILVAALEDEFKIMLDTDDIIDMSSIAMAKKILSKYEVAES
ncbi:MAG: acyl carrier protein [Aestuariibacter sp.]